MIKGIDISAYQPDFTRVPAGADFVIIKATEGRTWVNRYLVKQIAVARASGKQVGWYHWLHRGNVAAQIAHFLTTIAPHLRPGDLLCIDYERCLPNNPDPTEADLIAAVAETERLKPNHRVLSYMNLDWWRTRNKSKTKGDGLWLAHFGATPGKPGSDDWLLHQYTAPDYDPDVNYDWNVARFGSLAEMKSWARGKAQVGYNPPKLRERVLWRGRRACTCMIESIEKVVEPRLKAAGVIKYSIDIFQAAYSHASASAGTHAGGGAIDVAQDSDTAARIWREAGWAFWPRGEDYGFIEHGHGVLIGCPHLSSGARSQVTQYRNGTNGLKDHARDPLAWMDIDPISWREAIEDYLGVTAPPAAGGGSGPIYDDDIEEFLMTAEWHRPGCDFPQKLKKVGQWQYLYITNEANISFADGPARIAGHAYVTIDMKPGESAYFRTVEDEKNDDGEYRRRMTYEDHDEVPATGGHTYRRIPLHYNTGGPRDGWKANYVRIQWHSSDPDATIISAGVHSWDGKKED